jgi:hypothetical protein
MDIDALRSEAIAFGRYLVDATPSDELIERYRRANDVLLTEPPSPADQAVIDFACAHPRAIAMLDAGTAVSGQAPLFRKKLLVMMAIVETTPDFVDRTEPRGASLPGLAARLGISAAKTAVNIVAGLALSTAIASRRRG